MSGTEQRVKAVKEYNDIHNLDKIVERFNHTLLTHRAYEVDNSASQVAVIYKDSGKVVDVFVYELGEFLNILEGDRK